MISSGSTLAEDIGYALAHWDGLTRFLSDERLELDTSLVENAIRPICLTRKNALFAGTEPATKSTGQSQAQTAGTLSLKEPVRLDPRPRDERSPIR